MAARAFRAFQACLSDSSATGVRMTFQSYGKRRFIFERNHFRDEEYYKAFPGVIALDSVNFSVFPGKFMLWLRMEPEKAHLYQSFPGIWSR